MSEPASISALIDNWKPLSAFAAEVGCGYEAARKMKDRDSIAPEHWAKVVEAAKAKKIKGVTFEWLARKRAPQGADA